MTISVAEFKIFFFLFFSMTLLHSVQQTTKVMLVVRDSWSYYVHSTQETEDGWLWKHTLNPLRWSYTCVSCVSCVCVCMQWLRRPLELWGTSLQPLVWWRRTSSQLTWTYAYLCLSRALSSCFLTFPFTSHLCVTISVTVPGVVALQAFQWQKFTHKFSCHILSIVKSDKFHLLSDSTSCCGQTH